MKNIIKVKILGHDWSVRFLKRSLMHDEANGTCWTLHKSIDIAEDLEPSEARYIIVHELAHAIMGICGRTFEEALKQESISETIAWHIDEIVRVRDIVMEARFGK